MLIRYGYEISISCPQPTPLVCLLAVHEERKADIRVPETVFTVPDTPTTTYLDLFGNRCRRLVAPAGDLTLWGDATIEDDGKLDPVISGAREIPVADLPDDCLVYLMGSRYCETDRLSQVAWDTFGNIAPGWGRVQAICDFVNRHIRFDYQQARATRTAFEAYNEARRRVPRLRASGADLLPLPQHPGALHQRPSRRYRRAGGRPHGFFSLDRSLPRWRMAHLRPAQQRAAHRPHRHCARP